MSDSTLLIPLLLLTPPLIVSVFMGWIASGHEKESKAFKRGTWISLAVAVLYYGFLSVLAGINTASSDKNSAGTIFSIVLPIVITLVLTLLCFGAYLLVRRTFKRVRSQ